MRESIQSEDYKPDFMSQLIAENQTEYRNADYGVVSRPIELKWAEHSVNEKLKEVFSEYVDPQAPDVIISLSALPISIEKKAPYYADYRIPDTVAPKDTPAFTKGTYILNEWATNYAAAHFFSHFSQNQIIAWGGSAFANFYNSVFGKMESHTGYEVMDSVIKTSQTQRTSFDLALFDAYFAHNFERLNDLIAGTPQLQAHSLEQLAITIGDTQTKGFDLTKFLNNILTEMPQDSAFTRNLKLASLPLFAAGSHSRPGIVELWALGPSVVTLTGELSWTAPVSGIAVGVVTACTLASYLGFVPIHEMIHSYSTDTNYSGFIPVCYKKWDTTTHQGELVQSK